MFRKIYFAEQESNQALRLLHFALIMFGKGVIWCAVRKTQHARTNDQLQFDFF